jgi:hypothetical protein
MKKPAPCSQESPGALKALGRSSKQKNFQRVLEHKSRSRPDWPEDERSKKGGRQGRRICLYFTEGASPPADEKAFIK